MDISKGSGILYFDIAKDSNNIQERPPEPLTLRGHSFFHIILGAAGMGKYFPITKAELCGHKDWQAYCKAKLQEYIADPTKLELFSQRAVSIDSPTYPNNRKNLLHLFVQLINNFETEFDIIEAEQLGDSFIAAALRSGVNILEKDPEGYSFTAHILVHSIDPIETIKKLLPIEPRLLLDLTEDAKPLFEFILSGYYTYETINYLVNALSQEALIVNYEAVKTNKESVDLEYQSYILSAFQTRLDKEMLEKNITKSTSDTAQNTFKI